MTKVKMIIFDLDGTLVDAYQAVASSVNYSLKESGYPAVDDETIKRKVGWGDRHLVKQFVPEDRVDAVLSIYRQHHATALKSGTKFLPGARKLLSQLKEQGYRLAIATNRPTRFTHIILKHLKVEGYFDLVLCADKVKNAKPAPDLIEEILKRSAVVPEEAMYVGDMVIDAQTGRGAGVRTVIVVTGSSSEKEVRCADPYRVIRGISELSGILAGS